MREEEDCLCELLKLIHALAANLVYLHLLQESTIRT